MELPDQELLKLDENITPLLDPILQDGEVETIERLLKEIQNNFLGCDLSLSLFMAALNSIKRDRCLRPFPQSFINEYGKNFTELKNVCDNIPPLSDFIKEPNQCPKEVIQLLTWLFLVKSNPRFKRVIMEEIPILNGIPTAYTPHFVFEVCYKKESEEAWLKRKDNRDIILAFHGSGVENFYSILKVGLQQHFSLEKDVLFGKGIYLANEISISAHYSPFGPSWIHSELGRNQSIIAICEIINDVDKVKCKDAQNKHRSMNEGSLDEIPERYFVVTDSDMVRVKYLMVYKKNNSYPVRSIIRNNMFPVVVFIYIILIVIIRLHNRFTRWLYNYLEGNE